MLCNHFLFLLFEAQKFKRVKATYSVILLLKALNSSFLFTMNNALTWVRKFFPYEPNKSKVLYFILIFFLIALRVQQNSSSTRYEWIFPKIFNAALFYDATGGPSTNWICFYSFPIVENSTELNAFYIHSCYQVCNFRSNALPFNLKVDVKFQVDRPCKDKNYHLHLLGKIKIFRVLCQCYILRNERANPAAKSAASADSTVKKFDLQNYIKKNLTKKIGSTAVRITHILISLHLYIQSIPGKSR